MAYSLVWDEDEDEDDFMKELTAGEIVSFDKIRKSTSEEALSGTWSLAFGSRIGNEQ